MSKPAKKDRDEIVIARSIFDEIVAETEREIVPDTPKQARAKKAAAARAAKLSPAKRKAIAKKAAAKRWQR